MEEEKFEIIILEKDENGEPTLTMHNRLITYIPTEYQIIDYQRSWKKCHCGRQTHFNDLWCPSCGQKLGKPNVYDE